MVFSRLWPDPANDPANTDNISAGAQEIREGKDDIKERVNSILTDGMAMVLPATLANLDTRFNTNVDPLRVRGDRVDLRGCTWRRYTISHAGAGFTTSSTTFVSLVPDMVLTFTPVSSASLLEFHFESAVSHEGTFTASNAGIITRIRNATAGTDIALGGITNSNGGNIRSRHWHHLSDVVTGLSGAITFRVEVRLTAAASQSAHFLTGAAANGEFPWRFYCIEHV